MARLQQRREARSARQRNLAERAQAAVHRGQDSRADEPAPAALSAWAGTDLSSVAPPPPEESRFLQPRGAAYSYEEVHEISHAVLQMYAGSQAAPSQRSSQHPTTARAPASPVAVPRPQVPKTAPRSAPRQPQAPLHRPKLPSVRLGNIESRSHAAARTRSRTGSSCIHNGAAGPSCAVRCKWRRTARRRRGEGNASFAGPRRPGDGGRRRRREGESGSRV